MISKNRIAEIKETLRHAAYYAREATYDISILQEEIENEDLTELLETVRRIYKLMNVWGNGEILQLMDKAEKQLDSLS